MSDQDDLDSTDGLPLFNAQDNCPKCGSVSIAWRLRPPGRREFDLTSYSKDTILIRCDSCRYVWDARPLDQARPDEVEGIRKRRCINCLKNDHPPGTRWCDSCAAKTEEYMLKAQQAQAVSQSDEVLKEKIREWMRAPSVVEITQPPPQALAAYLPESVWKWIEHVKQKYIPGWEKGNFNPNRAANIDALAACSFCGHPLCHHGSGHCRHPWEGPGPYCACVSFVP